MQYALLALALLLPGSFAGPVLEARQNSATSSASAGGFKPSAAPIVSPKNGTYNDNSTYAPKPGQNRNIQVGLRPYTLIDEMTDGPLKQKLESCSEQTFQTSDWVIAHRGVPMFYPEHSKWGVRAAMRSGAGIIECDTTFTQEQCRHDFCDLHYTTDILSRPDLAKKCSTPFVPANSASPAVAKCCTTDITMAEFQTLCARMEGANPGNVTNVNAPYYDGRTGLTPAWRTELYDQECAQPMTYQDYLGLVDGAGLQFTPEAKLPNVKFPFNGNYTQNDFLQQMVDEILDRGISPARVWFQTFQLSDALYWVANASQFANNVILLDEDPDADSTPFGAAYEKRLASLPGLYQQGIRIIAPPTLYLVNVSANGSIVPSSYGPAARAAGLDVITWSVERDPPPRANSTSYYVSTVGKAMKSNGDVYLMIDALAQIPILGAFSDYVGTLTYYANCFGLKGGNNNRTLPSSSSASAL